METVNSQRNIEIVYNAKVYDRHIKSLLLFPLHIIITIQQSPYISSFKTINVSIVCLVVTFFFACENCGIRFTRSSTDCFLVALH